jgi:hypothetical protein
MAMLVTKARLSSPFASFTFTGRGLYRWMRWLLLITGAFAVMIPLQMFSDTWPSLVVHMTTPPEVALTAAVILLAVTFRREARATLR